MRVVYADAGLVCEVGHHANACRLITGALRDRGLSPEVVAFHRISPALAAALGARPYFRANTYWRDDGDELSGWMTAFFTGAEILAEDLLALGPWRAGDLLYVNSILPAQLMGIGMFLGRLPPDARPAVVAEFGTDPGLDFQPGAARSCYVARDPRQDPRAVLYRFAARQIEPMGFTALHLCAFDATVAELYSQLLGLPVQALPVPHLAGVAPRLRGQSGRRVVGVLGHQRVEKGYALVPAMCARLLSARADVELLVHNAEPARMKAAQASLHELAARHTRLRLDEREAGPAIWAGLLDACDLIVCPYDRNHFRAAYSAVTSEAIAHAIPLVVPAETTLARVVGAFGGGGVTFAGDTGESVAQAVMAALDDFDGVARRAMLGARLWAREMGAENMVEAMLGLAECSALFGETLAALEMRVAEMAGER